MNVQEQFDTVSIAKILDVAGLRLREAIGTEIG
jgi:hypothetical protein